MLITAHRGASGDAPENTLAAFRAALDQGCDAVELDVRLSRDGELLVIHDATAARTAGRDIEIAALSSEEAALLDAGAWRGEAWRGERIPTLAEVLEVLPKDLPLFVESKIGPEINSTLAGCLERSGRSGPTWIISKHLAMVSRYRQEHPGSRTLWIVNPSKMLPDGVADPGGWMLGQVLDAGLDGIGPRFGEGIDEVFCRRAHEAGLYVFSWTVDDPQAVCAAREAGIDALATNYPAAARAALAAE